MEQERFTIEEYLYTERDMGFTDLKTELGSDVQQKYKIDGTNYIDVFPIFTFEPNGAVSPDYGTITIQGVTMPTDLWADNEYIAVKFELNHEYKDGENCDIHTRVFPVNDNAGTVVFEFDYFVLHVDGTTSAGATATLSGTITAGDKTAEQGQYISSMIDGTNLVNGDQLIGTFKRDSSGTYGSDVSLMEIGCHIPVGQTGINF